MIAQRTMPLMPEPFSFSMSCFLRETRREGKGECAFPLTAAVVAAPCAAGTAPGPQKRIEAVEHQERADADAHMARVRPGQDVDGDACQSGERLTRGSAS